MERSVMEVQVTSFGIPSSCIKPAWFGKIKRSSIHHFSDASRGGCGKSSYLRLEDIKGKFIVFY